MIPEKWLWKDALERLREVDAAWPSDGAGPEELAAHEAALAECRDWLAAQEPPRIAKLADQLVPGISRRRFWCALVPAEREVAKVKITDVDILDRDLPPETVPAFPPLPVTVLLDSLRSAFNVGGIFRTAECFGFGELVLCGYTPLPETPAVARAALGSEKLLKWRAGGKIADEIAALRRQGVVCYALETVSGAAPMEDFQWRFPCAVVLGNERFGLTAETVKLCDQAVRIPLYGRKNSLNVGSAFAILAHELRLRFRH